MTKMENLTKKINIVKSTVLGLGLLALTALPLNAQKYESDYIKKNNLSYCIYGRGIKHNSHYFKKEKEENYCISKAAKKSNSYYCDILRPLKVFCLAKNPRFARRTAS